MCCLVVRVAGGAGCICSHIKDELLTSGPNEVYFVDKAGRFDESTIKVSNLQVTGKNPHIHFTEFDWMEFAGIAGAQHFLSTPSNSVSGKNSGLPWEKGVFYISPSVLRLAQVSIQKTRGVFEK